LLANKGGTDVNYFLGWIMQVRFWVTSLGEVSGNEFAANGCSFAGDFGLGLDGQGHLLRSYNGRIVLIDGGGRRECIDGHIDLRHSTVKGFDWIIRSKKLLSGWRPPFLVTNHCETELFVDGVFEIELNEFGQSVSADSWIGPIPVTTSDGAMIAIIESGKAVESKLTGKIKVFLNNSCLENAVLGARLCLYPHEPVFGTLNKIPKQS
jgi:hypothetical protein